MRFYRLFLPTVPSAAPTNVTVDAIVEEPTHLRVDWIDVPAEEAHGIIRGHYIYYCFLADLSNDKGHLGSTASPNGTSCIGELRVQCGLRGQPLVLSDIQSCCHSITLHHSTADNKL